jgi:hypothetical protein
MVYFAAAIQQRILTINESISAILKPEWDGDKTLMETTLLELNREREYLIRKEEMEEQKKRLREEKEEQEQRIKQKLQLRKDINRKELEIETSTDDAKKKQLALELKDLQEEMDVNFGGLF